MTKAISLKQVNAAIAKAGIPLELERDDGYHYFIFDRPDINVYETESVMTCYTSHVSLERWVEWAEYTFETIKGNLAKREIEI